MTGSNELEERLRQCEAELAELTEIRRTVAR